MRIAAFMILVLVTVSLFLVPTYASNVTITVENGQVQERLDLSFQQNITQLPTFTGTVTQATDARLSSAFKQALSRALPGAIPSDLVLNVHSTENALTVGATITVDNVSERRGDILSSSLGWKSFNVSSDLHAGNLSYNTVGEQYLWPVTDFYRNASLRVGRSNSTFTGVNFFINKTGVSGYTADNYVGNFTLLNFKALGVPVEDWTRSYSLANNTTTWRYTPSKVLDISIGIQRLNQTMTISASYGYQAEVSVQGVARAHGNTLLLDVGTGQKEWVMLGIVTFTVILAIVAQFLFRARRKKYAKFGRW